MELAPSPVQEKRGRPGRPPSVKEGEPIDLGIKVDPKKSYVFELLQKSEANRVVFLSGECKIFDPVERRPRVIRYIPQADSIYKELQDEAYTDSDVRPLYFSRNQLVIEGTDIRGLEYCLKHDQYDGVKAENRLSKKGAFYTLVDKDKHETKIGQQLDREVLALKMISEAEIDTLRPMARIVFNILDTDAQVIKNRLREHAKRQPRNFEKSGALQIIESLDNPNLIRRYNIQVAIDKGILEIDNQKGMCVWGDSKNQIVAINPAAKMSSQVGELAGFTFTPAGREFFEVLKERMD